MHALGWFISGEWRSEGGWKRLLFFFPITVFDRSDLIKKGNIIGLFPLSGNHFWKLHSFTLTDFSMGITSVLCSHYCMFGHMRAYSSFTSIKPLQRGFKPLAFRPESIYQTDYPSPSGMSKYDKRCPRWAADRFSNEFFYLKHLLCSTLSIMPLPWISSLCWCSNPTCFLGDYAYSGSWEFFASPCSNRHLL